MWHKWMRNAHNLGDLDVHVDGRIKFQWILNNSKWGYGLDRTWCAHGNETLGYMNLEGRFLDNWASVGFWRSNPFYELVNQLEIMT